MKKHTRHKKKHIAKNKKDDSSKFNQLSVIISEKSLVALLQATLSVLIIFYPPNVFIDVLPPKDIDAALLNHDQS